jgi:hypothetical protein
MTSLGPFEGSKCAENDPLLGTSGQPYTACNFYKQDEQRFVQE